VNLLITVILAVELSSALAISEAPFYLATHRTLWVSMKVLWHSVSWTVRVRDLAGVKDRHIRAMA
jgi:hypothetical protein